MPAYYITTPIYYVNDSPHIGHAYTTLACDVLARFMRLDGYDVTFLTGTDEHGLKVDKAARAADVDPQSFTDMVSQRFRDLAEKMEFSNDDFVRTTEKRHKKAAQAIWKAIAQNEDNIYLGSYAGWYSVRDEAFYQESELIEGKAPTGAEVEWVEEPSYFFALSKWQDRLLEFYERNPDFVGPQTRYNEVISFVKGGLKDLSISRTSFSWGVTVPGDKKHVMYVWLDALTNYLTGVGYPDTSDKQFKTFWPADLHMVGKDILRFHAVYWPAFLMAAGIEPPKRVFAHGWWTNEGEKISKSLGNVIDPIKLVDEFGLDQVRYFLLREVPFGNDGNYTRDSMLRTINADLANNVGNLAQRTLSMIHKNCGGKIPKANRTEEDARFNDIGHAKLEVLREQMQNQRFHLVLEKIISISSEANNYIDAQAPWKLKKTDPERMETVLYTLAETIRQIAILLQPFIPNAANALLDQLAIPEDQRLFSHLSEEYLLKPGAEIPKPEPIFPRLEEEKEAV